MLSFLGTGSAFNTELGNNNAFLLKEQTLLLIDCGGMTFSKLHELKILDGVKQVHVIITHTHPDHVGSLGDIIFYMHYILNSNVRIYFPEEKLMRDYLRCIGASDDLYELCSSMNVEIEDHYMKALSIEFHKTKHVESIPSYGFILRYDGKTLYYSGDSCELSDQLVEQLKNNEIDAIYHDTSGIDYNGNSHLSFNKLKLMISRDIRNKVFCMHFDKYVNVNEIKSEGFNVVEVYKP